MGYYLLEVIVAGGIIGALVTICGMWCQRNERSDTQVTVHDYDCELEEWAKQNLPYFIQRKEN